MPFSFLQRIHFRRMKKNHDCPLHEVFLACFKSAYVLRRAYQDLLEFLVKKSKRYNGAISCISWSMVFQPKLSISSLPVVSKHLLVTILAVQL